MKLLMVTTMVCPTDDYLGETTYNKSIQILPNILVEEVPVQELLARYPPSGAVGMIGNNGTSRALPKSEARQ